MSERQSKGAEFDCRYNKGVMCEMRSKCNKCGWNPAVNFRRLEKIRAEMEQPHAEDAAC